MAQDDCLYDGNAIAGRQLLPRFTYRVLAPVCKQEVSKLGNLTMKKAPSVFILFGLYFVKDFIFSDFLAQTHPFLIGFTKIKLLTW